MFIQLWMQRDVVTITKESTIGEAKEILTQHSFRHLPVTEKGKLIGILTKTDVNRALPSDIDSSVTPQDRIVAAQAKVAMFMTEHPLTVAPGDPLEDVAILMRKFKVGAIPVVEDEQLLGIITESDIFNAFAEILGGHDEDTRIELQIEKNRKAFYKVVSVCQDFDMDLTTITLYKNFSLEHQLLTIRVKGEEIEDMIDALWETGAKVNKVI